MSTPASAKPSSEPFPFIVGCARSGTTLLRAMLDSHPSMAIPYEARVAWGMTKDPSRYEGSIFDADRFAADVSRRAGFERWGLSEGDLREALAAAGPTTTAEAVRVVYRTYARSQNKERYGEKTPSNALLITDIAAAFPESVFIHVVRDGRNVALSIKAAWWWKRSLAEALVTWDRTVSGGRVQGRPLGPARYREVRYEDLVRDPEPTLRELCAFIGLPFDPSILRYYERADAIVKEQDAPAEFENLRKPPTQGVRDWRTAMTPREVELADAAAGDLLEAFAYGRGTDGPSLAARAEIASTRARMKSREIYSSVRRAARRTSRRPPQPTSGS